MILITKSMLIIMLSTDKWMNIMEAMSLQVYLMCHTTISKCLQNKIIVNHICEKKKMGRAHTGHYNFS